MTDEPKPNGETDASNLHIRVVAAICSDSPWSVRTSACLAMMAQVFEHAEYAGTKELDILPVYGEIMPEMRQRVVGEASVRDATHILWVGPKMLFPPDALNYLLKFNMPVVAANYTTGHSLTSAIPSAYVDSDDYTGPLYTDKDSEGVVEVSYVGMGFMLTDTRVFLDHVFPELPYFQYEPQPPSNMRFASEEIFFCRQVRKAGIPILVSQDLSKDVHYHGDHVYTAEDACRLRQFNVNKADAWASEQRARFIGPRDEMVRNFMEEQVAVRVREQ